MAETFSVMPLAGLAAGLVTGRLPRLCGAGALGDVNAADGSTAAGEFGVLCSDVAGITSGVRVQRLDGEGA